MWFKSQFGIEVHEIKREDSMCARLVMQKSPLVVEDLSQHTDFQCNPLVHLSQGVHFYAGVPLMNIDGYFLGSLCVMDTKVRSISANQLDALVVLGRQVMAQLELRRSFHTLARSYTEQKRAQSDLRNAESFYHSLVESIPQNIFRKDAEGHFTFANQRFCNTFGHTIKDIIGKTDFDVFPIELAENTSETTSVLCPHGKFSIPWRQTKLWKVIKYMFM